MNSSPYLATKSPCDKRCTAGASLVRRRRPAGMTSLPRHTSRSSSRQTPDARRQTPDARRQTPDARRQTQHQHQHRPRHTSLPAGDLHPSHRVQARSHTAVGIHSAPGATTRAQCRAGADPIQRLQPGSFGEGRGYQPLQGRLPEACISAAGSSRRVAISCPFKAPRLPARHSIAWEFRSSLPRECRAPDSPVCTVSFRGCAFPFLSVSYYEFYSYPGMTNNKRFSPLSRRRRPLSSSHLPSLIIPYGANFPRRGLHCGSGKW